MPGAGALNIVYAVPVGDNRGEVKHSNLFMRERRRKQC